MSLAILALGTLVDEPVERTSRDGKAYATARLRVPTEEEPAWVSIIAFDPAAVRALLAHAKGDTIAVTGRAKLTMWEKNDAHRAGLSVVVEGVLSAYQLEKRRTAARAEGAATKEHA
jgi:single-stranded DNA-binding protein